MNHSKYTVTVTVYNELKKDEEEKLTTFQKINFSEPEPEPEKVNSPQHYQSSTVEVIEVIEAFNLNFNLGNICKYVLRSGSKGDQINDLRKALWYLSREVAKLEKGGN